MSTRVARLGDLQVGDIRLLVQSRYVETRGTLDIDYTFVSRRGVETRRGSHRAYTVVELLEGAGFSVETSAPWTREAHVVTFIAAATPSH